MISTNWIVFNGRKVKDAKMFELFDRLKEGSNGFCRILGDCESEGKNIRIKNAHNNERKVEV